jgi:Tfp pilus assembly protein PilN
MKYYSFIVPRKKHFISLFSKLWLAFIAVMVVFLLVFDFYISVEMHSFRLGIVELTAQREALEARIDQDDEEISLILREKALSEEVYSNNTLLKESMKNLFDLVPDQITLKKVEMERNSLILYGVSPTQDTFNFLLAAPLKSIFHTSNTTFYLTKEGWYNFVSVNKIIGTDGIRE